MKVLVTGGSGFIGGHLVEHLSLSHDTVIYDTKALAYPLSGFHRFSQGDLLDYERLLSVTKNVDYIFHLGAMANTIECADCIPEAVKVNCLGTANVLQAALKNNVKRVFIASSSLVSDRLYGYYKSKCFEDVIDMGAIGHIYTTTKLFTELLVRDYFTMYGLPYTILRFGICYGPRMTAGVLVDTFIRQALSGQCMTIDGDGEQWRYYMYIDDLVDGCIKAMAPVAINQTINLVPSWQTTIKQVAETIQELVGGEIVYQKRRKFDFELKELRNDNIFGWEAITKLEDGLRKTINWYQTERGMKWNA